MRQVLFMAVLAAGMLLVGCSKDESNDMDTKGSTEQERQQEIVNRFQQEIVGTWEHDGDAYFKNISDIGTIRDGILHDCKVEFSDYVPARLVFNSDGTLQLTVDCEEPWGVNCGGTYEIRAENYEGVIGFILRYDQNYYETGRYYFNYFRAYLVFFDMDYKTLYFTSQKNGAPNVGRYRRVL